MDALESKLECRVFMRMLPEIQTGMFNVLPFLFHFSRCYILNEKLIITCFVTYASLHLSAEDTLSLPFATPFSFRKIADLRYRNCLLFYSAYHTCE
jgi:hypothetical protein